MKTINDLKKEREDKVNDLINQCGMFFAFSNEQFQENKTPLQEGEKYVHVGHGGYMPKGKVEMYIKGLEDIGKWYKGAIKDNNQRKANILYELKNHEAFYTYDIEDTLAALGEDYTEAEVWTVFNANVKKQTA